MALTAIKQEEVANSTDLTKSSEKTGKMPPLSSSENLSEIKAMNEVNDSQSKIYVNSLRIATSIAAAISGKTCDSLMSKSWPERDCHTRNANDEFNEDIDIDGDDYVNEQSEDEGSQLMNYKITNRNTDSLSSPNGPTFNGSTTSSNSVNSTSSNSYTNDNRSSANQRLVASLASSWANSSDPSTSSHSSPACPTHTIDAILGLRNLHQSHQEALLSPQNFASHNPCNGMGLFSSSDLGDNRRNQGMGRYANGLEKDAGGGREGDPVTGAAPSPSSTDDCVTSAGEFHRKHSFPE